jgi:SAM-dependent methyltransferase
VKPTMTTTEAILKLRADPAHRGLIESSYLGEDVDGEVARFSASVELRETLALLPDLAGQRVLDLGAGTGLAARALLDAGAEEVIALEPETDEVVGLGVLAPRVPDQPIHPVAGLGDQLPLPDASIDLVYCRQVLHHLPDLGPSLRECARVLRPGGRFVATREHVVDDEQQRREFLAQHQVHQLAGGEGAWSLDAYLDAMTTAGLGLEHVLGPWDSVINAYPTARTATDLLRGPELVLAERGGPLLGAIGRLPGVRQMLWRRLRRPKPGRLYSFVAVKPHVA